MPVAIKLVRPPLCADAEHDASNVLNAASHCFFAARHGDENPALIFESFEPVLLARLEWKNPMDIPYPFTAKNFASKFRLETNNGFGFQEVAEWDAAAREGWHSQTLNIPYKSQQWRLICLEFQTPQWVLEAVLLVAEVGTCGLGQKLWLDRDFTDVEVVVGDRRFPAHRNVLAAASPVFASMLRSGMKEDKVGEVRLEDAGDLCVEDTLEFMYTGRMAGREPFGALRLGHKYDIQGLLEHAAPLALDSLTVENVIVAVRVLRPYVGDEQLGAFWESLRDKIHGNKDLLTAALLEL